MYSVLLEHRRLKFYAVTHNNPKNPEYLIAISLLQVRHLNYLFFDNFGAQLQAPVIRGKPQFPGQAHNNTGLWYFSPRVRLGEFSFEI